MLVPNLTPPKLQGYFHDRGSTSLTIKWGIWLSSTLGICIIFIIYFIECNCLGYILTRGLNPGLFESNIIDNRT